MAESYGWLPAASPLVGIVAEAIRRGQLDDTWPHHSTPKSHDEDESPRHFFARWTTIGASLNTGLACGPIHLGCLLAGTIVISIRKKLSEEKELAGWARGGYNRSSEADVRHLWYAPRRIAESGDGVAVSWGSRPRARYPHPWILFRAFTPSSSRAQAPSDTGIVRSRC